MSDHCSWKMWNLQLILSQQLPLIVTHVENCYVESCKIMHIASYGAQITKDVIRSTSYSKSSLPMYLLGLNNTLRTYKVFTVLIFLFLKNCGNYVKILYLYNDIRPIWNSKQFFISSQFKNLLLTQYWGICREWVYAMCYLMRKCFTGETSWAFIKLWNISTMDKLYLQ